MRGASGIDISTINRRISLKFPEIQLLVGGLEHGFYFSIQLGMSSSQLTLTPSFFRWVGGEKPPTR